MKGCRTPAKKEKLKNPEKLYREAWPSIKYKGAFVPKKFYLRKTPKERGVDSREPLQVQCMTRSGGVQPSFIDAKFEYFLIKILSNEENAKTN